MVGKLFAVTFIALILYGVECKSPPKVDGSFIAWGEIVQPIADNFTLQISFEESYDKDSKNAAFFLWFGGKNITFVKTQVPDQTFMYIETDKKVIDCLETSETEWIESDFEASLMGFVDDQGKVKFSLNQLFSLPEKFLTDKGQGVPTTYRGIPAESWTYEHAKKEFDGNDSLLAITAYWADGTFSTSAGKTVAPLGFNLSKIIWTKPPMYETYIINVYGFVPDAYDHKFFKAVEGVVCETRNKTLSFPNVGGIKAISIHTEMALPDYQELRYFDTWFDPGNQLLRVDIERMKDEDPMEREFKKYQKEVSIGKLGVVYRYSYVKGESSCEVIPFNKYESDLQNLFDVKQDKWRIGKLFGVDNSTYVYIGKTVKHDTPCHVFQGIRKDWPDKDSGTESLWEWCFNVNMSKVGDIMMFKDDEFGLVSAQVKILNSKDPDYINYRMNFHFYEVKAQDPKILASTSFDIGSCFSDLEKRGLQFALDLKLDHDTTILAANATSDIDFLQKWRWTLYSSSQLQDYSLRISDLRSTIDGGKMYVKFYILDVHKDLPKDKQKDMISSADAEKKLRESIDAGKVSITHEWKKGEKQVFVAVKGSLEYQLDPNFKPVTMPPVIPSSSTTPSSTPFTLETDPPTIKKHIAKYTGNQPGAVAGVSIAMLLVGVTIGSFSTFYKYNGMPSFLRR